MKSLFCWGIAFAMIGAFLAPAATAESSQSSYWLTAKLLREQCDQGNETASERLKLAMCFTYLRGFMEAAEIPFSNLADHQFCPSGIPNGETVRLIFLKVAAQLEAKGKFEPDAPAGSIVLAGLAVEYPCPPNR